MLTDVNANDCTRGCTDTVREAAVKVDFWRKIHCRIGELNLHQRRVGLTLYLLTFISALRSECNNDVTSPGSILATVKLLSYYQ